jgi:hypothetical protein
MATGKRMNISGPGWSGEDFSEDQGNAEEATDEGGSGAGNDSADSSYIDGEEVEDEANDAESSASETSESLDGEFSVGVGATASAAIFCLAANISFVQDATGTFRNRKRKQEALPLNSRSQKRSARVPEQCGSKSGKQPGIVQLYVWTGLVGRSNQIVAWVLVLSLIDPNESDSTAVPSVASADRRPRERNSKTWKKRVAIMKESRPIMNVQPPFPLQEADDWESVNKAVAQYTKQNNLRFRARNARLTATHNE